MKTTNIGPIFSQLSSFPLSLVIEWVSGMLTPGARVETLGLFRQPSRFNQATFYGRRTVGRNSPPAGRCPRNALSTAPRGAKWQAACTFLAVLTAASSVCAVAGCPVESPLHPPGVVPRRQQLLERHEFLPGGEPQVSNTV